MNLWFIFTRSLKLPNKKALFSLNRMNMRDTLVYINLLFLILFLPDVIAFVQNIKSVSGIIPDVVIIQVVFLYPALTIFLTTVSVSALAGLAYIIRNILNRKLAYHQLWKMTSYALTIPIFICLIFKVVEMNELAILLVSFMIYLIIILSMIKVYPKKKSHS